MPKKTKKKGKTTAEINAMVTEFFCDIIRKSLESGDKKLPWQKPWVMNKIGGVRNGATNRSYSGINIWLLAASGHNSPCWFTYKQAQDCGGNVKKGEK